MQNPNPVDDKSAMTGFDPEFRDLDHYIRVITARIWEGRRIDDIRRYYSDPCVVETPAAVTTSIEDVINGTRATLAVFPDRRLLAEDIIQSGDAIGGFLSSHRIISTMTHQGDGSFGAPSNQHIHVRTIADCVCKNNRIIHEWLVRDQSAIARHIGIAPRVLAQRWLDERAGWDKPLAPPSPPGYVSHISDDPAARAYADVLAAFAARKCQPQDVECAYDDAVHHLGPGGVTRYGHQEVAQYWRELFACFVVHTFVVEHLVVQRGGDRPERIALRWRAQTTHQSSGVTAPFGTATGRAVEIMGINHVECWRGRVLREWVLVDEIALWMQVLSPTT